MNLDDSLKRSYRNKVFTRWCNAQIVKKYGPKAKFIRNLAIDFSPGVLIINIVHAVFEVPNPKRLYAKPSGRKQLTENMKLAFGMIEEAGMPYISDWIDYDEIIDQNLDTCLNLVWILICQVYALFLPRNPPTNSLYHRTVDIGKQMVDWCNRRFGETGMRISDMVEGWRDGMALCTLASVMRADSITLSRCDANRARQSTNTALNALSRFCQIPATVSAEEWLHPGPDDLCTLVFLVEVLVYYRKKWNRPGHAPGTPLQALPPCPIAPGCAPSTDIIPGALGLAAGSVGSGVRRSSQGPPRLVTSTAAPQGANQHSSGSQTINLGEMLGGSAAAGALPSTLAGLTISAITPRSGTATIISPGREVIKVQSSGAPSDSQKKKDKKSKKLLGKLTLRGSKKKLNASSGDVGAGGDASSAAGSTSASGADSSGFPNAHRGGTDSPTSSYAGSRSGSQVNASAPVQTVICPNCNYKNRALASKTQIECFNCNFMIPIVPKTDSKPGSASPSANSSETNLLDSGSSSVVPPPHNAYDKTPDSVESASTGTSSLLSLTGPPPAALSKKKSKRRGKRAGTDDDDESGGAVNKNLGKFAWEIPYEELIMSKKLGRGAFGVVFRGKWRMQKVAVKQILSKKITQKQFDEFYAESELMMSLRPHNNVVQLLGVAVDPKKPLCIVTEFLANGSLYDYIMNEKTDYGWDFVLKVLEGVTAGMYHLHREKILHRDLAARNILLSQNFEAKVADFGLSKKVINPTEDQESYFRGAFKYMAPESLSKNVFSNKTDIWSFGVVVWEVLTRKAPFANMDIYAAAKKIKRGIRLKLPDVTPSSVQHLCQVCWYIEPDKRPQFDELDPYFEDIEDDDVDQFPPLPLDPPEV